MSTNNVIISKDRKGKISRFSGIEDWNKILKDFKECMSRYNHGGVLSDSDYEEPIEPTAALDRLRGIGVNPPLPTDARDKSDVVKAIKPWDTSCVTVMVNCLLP